MFSLLPAYGTWVSQQTCTRVIVSRHLVSCPRRRVHSAVGNGDKLTFEAVGIRRELATSLRAAFPHVEHPTPMQRKLISAIFGKKDVVLQDHTGSGKSFAVMLALLNKQRAMNSGKGARKTTLVMVPHRDLAYQYLRWIQNIGAAQGTAVSSIAKVLVRGSYPESAHKKGSFLVGSILSPSSDLTALCRDPPHILICTPNAIMDMILRKAEALHLHTLSTVVVDEVDSLLEWVPSRKSHSTKTKIRTKMDKHPMVLRQIMDILFASETGNHHSLASDHVPVERPQLILLSATMRRTLRDALYDDFGWLKPGNVTSLIRAPSKSLPAHALNKQATHHVLVVSEDGSIKNLPGACLPKEEEKSWLAGHEGVEGVKDSLYEEDDDEFSDVDADIAQAPLAINPAVLEAVASAVALDVPRAALFVLPDTASVRKIVFELRQLGVDARALDLFGNGAPLSSHDMDTPAENPVLHVSTLATTRGIDLPKLTHVFLLGVPRGRSGDTYLHMGGRVGRFGGKGKVVTILETGEPKRMTVLLKRLGIRPTQFTHFE